MKQTLSPIVDSLAFPFGVVPSLTVKGQLSNIINMTDIELELDLVKILSMLFQNLAYKSLSTFLLSVSDVSLSLGKRLFRISHQ